MASTIQINHRTEIPLTEIRFRFSRSGGKGGQNVNKVESKVELLFDVGNSTLLTVSQKQAIIKRLPSYIDHDGIIHIEAQESRSQWQNREIAIKRLVELLQKALRPIKKRIKTVIPVASKHQRLVDKKRRTRMLKNRKPEVDD
jgi:ribosome-associated protein